MIVFVVPPPPPPLCTAALTYLHSKHIAHCDLSLENVVIRPSDLRLCILDFGLCVATNGAGHSEELLLRPPHGKAKYQAPEVRLGQRERSRAKAARARAARAWAARGAPGLRGLCTGLRMGSRGVRVLLLVWPEHPS